MSHEHLPSTSLETLELTCDQRTPMWVSMEPTSVELALRNLIDNAIKYTPPDGWVCIEEDPSEPRWFISIRGVGYRFTG